MLADTIADIIVTEKRTYVYETDISDIQIKRKLDLAYITPKQVIFALKRCGQVADAWTDEVEVGPDEYDTNIIIQYRQ